MLEQIISGGQTGADLGALIAARKMGVRTGGYAPRGWLIESDTGTDHIPAPWLKTRFGLKECPDGYKTSDRYVARRKANAAMADATIVFWKDWTPGTRGVLQDLWDLRKPVAIIIADRNAYDCLENPYFWHIKEFGNLYSPNETTEVAEFIRLNEFSIVNVAGPRASKAPKVEQFVTQFLCKTFASLFQLA